ncbi:hypothetical protein ACFLYY_02295 [Patescibacteria group bacterium]
MNKEELERVKKNNKIRVVCRYDKNLYEGHIEKISFVSGTNRCWFVGNVEGNGKGIMIPLSSLNEQEAQVIKGVREMVGSTYNYATKKDSKGLLNENGKRIFKEIEEKHNSLSNIVMEKIPLKFLSLF